MKRRQLFTPYAVRNHTGSPLQFVPITVHPSQVGEDTEVLKQMNMDWIEVAPNEEMPFNFHRKQKIRHKVCNIVVVMKIYQGYSVTMVSLPEHRNNPEVLRYLVLKKVYMENEQIESETAVKVSLWGVLVICSSSSCSESDIYSRLSEQALLYLIT